MTTHFIFRTSRIIEKTSSVKNDHEHTSTVVSDLMMKHTRMKGKRKRRYEFGYYSPSFATMLGLLMASSVSTRHVFLGCEALVTRTQVHTIGGSLPTLSRCFSRSSHTVETEHGNSENASQRDTKAPKLILPSHPDFPITSVMAPMVALSDYPFRVFLRENGVALTFTQMILAKKFINDKTFRKAHLDFYETTDRTGPDLEELVPSQLECIGDLELYRERQIHLRDTGKPFMQQTSTPLMVQLAGDNVDDVVKTAMMIYEHTEGKLHGIDLNCGCPQQIASKGNYGAFLMERDPQQINKILRALRKNLPPEVCVSAKIRLPMDDDTLVKERIPGLLESGISFLTIHGRTIKENKQTVKGAHIDRMKLAVETAHMLDPTFPVIANGGMENFNDIQQILQAMGASAAMSSEALLETPDIFQEKSMSYDKSPDGRFRRQLSFAKGYLDTCTIVGPPLPGVNGYQRGGSFNTVRTHLFKFLHRYINNDHKDLRDRLAANGASTMRTLEEARSLIEELESRYQNLTPDQWAELKSSSPQSSWYRRHRQPGRSVHERNNLIHGKPSTEREAMSPEKRKQQIRERLEKIKIQKSKRSNQRSKQFI